MKPPTLALLALTLAGALAATPGPSRADPPAQTDQAQQPPKRAPDLPADASGQPAQEATPADELIPLAHVERRGDGPIQMVLIPSLWCDWTVWNEFMDRNRERYTMYAVTYPGYAGSDPPPTPPDPRDYTQQAWRDNAARAILKLIRDEKLDKPVLVGHFAGGQLAIRLAIEHPGLIGAAVSVDGPLAVPLAGNTGPATPEERAIIANRRMNAERVPQEFWEDQVRQNAQGLVSNPGRAVLLGDMMARVPWNVAKGYWIEFIAEDLTARSRGLTSPLLVVVPIAPDLDPAQRAVVRDRWRAMFEPLETAKIVFVEDSRQFVMFDKPELLDDAIGAFLAESAGEDATEPEAPASKPRTAGQ